MSTFAPDPTASTRLRWQVSDSLVLARRNLIHVHPDAVTGRLEGLFQSANELFVRSFVGDENNRQKCLASAPCEFGVANALADYFATTDVS